MRNFLLVLVISTFSLGSYAQSGPDFPSFGDELLVQKNKIEIFPNPSVDFLNVHIKNSDLKVVVIIVHNIIGSKFEIKVEITNENQYRIDVRDLPRGYYLLSVKDAATKFSKTYKFLKR